MKIAIVGTGIAGNVAAYHLNKEHDITVFEANSHVGGHTHTHDIDWNGKTYAIDTGFIVFNYRTYPNFIQLLDELGVEIQPSNMSFSARCDVSDFEYSGSSLNTLFAQRSNLFRPRFYRMIREIMRFNKEALELLNSVHQEMTLGEYLKRGQYHEEFVRYYIIPMGSAIWSTDPDMMYRFPATYFIRFFYNHGLLNISDRPTWYVIKGGSREYVKKLTASFSERIRLNSTVEWIKRVPDGVLVKAKNSDEEHFDSVFIASHSDQALAMLSDATELEKRVLGAIPYQHNDVVLHTDNTMLPKRQLAWSAWNAHVSKSDTQRASLTYNMNILQSLDAQEQFCVTLNNSDRVDSNKVIKRLSYQHPVYTPDGVRQQSRQHEINGNRHTYYCGAYWRHGFHEDGVVSALNALEHFNTREGYAQFPIRRVG
ncbi:MAG: FAD-dependent oxidoreductase [Gammaproteobacteria bacterium]|nr:FAD-dependent oxidoreductase [Gammaproteobacteria bacterium]